MGPQVEALPLKYREVAVSVADIKAWDTPLAAQFKIRSIPAFAVYDGTGKLIAEGQSASDWVREQVNRGQNLPNRKPRE